MACRVVGDKMMAKEKQIIIAAVLVAAVVVWNGMCYWF